MKSLYFLLSSLSLLLAAQVRFDNEQVIRLPSSPKNLQTVQSLHLDIWDVSKDGIDVRVSPTQRRLLGQRLGPQAQAISVIIKNVQDLVDAEAAEMKQADELFSTSAAKSADDWHKNYHSFAEITTWMKNLADQHSDIAIFQPSIGKTEEGRDIPMLLIKSPKLRMKAQSEVKSAFLQAQQHAREWIAGATLQYVADTLVNQYGKDSTVTSLLDQVQVKIIPICNPDGYEYTRTKNRMWRKNRGANGKGVDPNRNWPDHWGTGGSSSNPSDDTYMGTKPGDAKEVQALMKEYSATPNVIAAVDFHSFSQLILRPYGWGQTRSPDESIFIQLGDKINSAYHGTYTSERVVDLYVASGGASDWWYGEGTKVGQRKPYAISIELPPKSIWNGGFDLPPSNIIPVGKDTCNAIYELLKHSLSFPLGVKTSSE